jgi:hypothetical protein
VRSREFSLSNETHPGPIGPLFWVLKNRDFFTSDFRDFFYAQHLIPGFLLHRSSLSSIGIEMRELLIFKGGFGNTPFSQNLIRFFPWNFLFVWGWASLRVSYSIWIPSGFPFWIPSGFSSLIPSVFCIHTGAGGIIAAKPSVEKYKIFL